MIISLDLKDDTAVMSLHVQHKNAAAKQSASKRPQESTGVGKAAAWAAVIGIPLAILALIVAVFPNESHDVAVALLRPIFHHRQLPPPRDLKRYVTFAVSGVLQHGYKFSSDSKVVIDTETGMEMDANITVVGPNTKEDFIAKPIYDTNLMWQWVHQGSLNGSLDFQNNPGTFVKYSGGAPLTHSAYWTPSLGDGSSTSSDTVFKPIASSEILTVGP